MGVGGALWRGILGHDSRQSSSSCEAPGSSRSRSGRAGQRKQKGLRHAGIRHTALAEELRGKVAFAWGPEVMEYGMREFAIRDPNGYYLAFTEPA